MIDQRERARFTPTQLDYLKRMWLGRLATVGPDGTPHVVPVGFRVRTDEGVIDVGGRDLASTRKFRDLQANPAVAFVVDDHPSVDPWIVHGVEIRGRAETHEEGGAEAFGRGFGPAWIRIHPEHIAAWGLDGPSDEREGR